MAASESTSAAPAAPAGKRLIVCCDGTWMDSDSGYSQGIFGGGTLQVPSNVTRISRCFKRRCSDGKLQIISYESGVGTGSTFVDSITGGAFGLGLSERVRESYSYLCANYMDGDEIFLVGFSRGAFTVRSVAGMIGQIGLLTRKGVEHFYNIFKDMQNWMNDDYEDEFPNLPFPNKPKGPHAAEEYRARLEKMGYTRVRQGNGDLIKIKGVCVWDTVGSLGIPRIAFLDRFGIRADNDEFKWHDTSLSDRIENAFQALALDETRTPFSPAVWERLPSNHHTTDLRQVWFPGNHGNCGGGWEDQGVANSSLAWMIDQMASVGVEFDLPAIERIFKQNFEYYKMQSEIQATKNKKMGILEWAVKEIYESNQPLRPWALGKISKTSSLFYWISGHRTRTPGMYKQADPKTERETSTFLGHTNERVHSSVRVRLACKGLGLNDKNVWTCPALSNWKLTQTADTYEDPIPARPLWAPQRNPDDDDFYVEHPSESGGGRWVWEYAGWDSEGHPDMKQRVMVEEPVGPYEKLLLKLSCGKLNVYEYAGKMGLMKH